MLLLWPPWMAVYLQSVFPAPPILSLRGRHIAHPQCSLNTVALCPVQAGASFVEHVANIKCRAKHQLINYSIFRLQFSSVAQSCPTTCDPMNRSTPGLPVHHQLPESTETHVHWIGDAMQLVHPLSSPSPPALNLSQHQGLFKWVSSLHQVAKVLEFQFQHQSFQWTPRTDLL